MLFYAVLIFALVSLITLSFPPRPFVAISVCLALHFYRISLYSQKNNDIFLGGNKLSTCGGIQFLRSMFCLFP